MFPLIEVHTSVKRVYQGNVPCSVMKRVYEMTASVRILHVMSVRCVWCHGLPKKTCMVQDMRMKMILWNKKQRKKENILVSKQRLEWGQPFVSEEPIHMFSAKATLRDRSLIIYVRCKRVWYEYLWCEVRYRRKLWVVLTAACVFSRENTHWPTVMETNTGSVQSQELSMFHFFIALPLKVALPI